jgi:RHS repeat-associated protein
LEGAGGARGVLAVLKDASSWKAVAADTLGNVLALAGTNGDFTRRTFDPWGNPLVRDASGSLRAATLNERRADYDALPLAWASQEVDPDTGLTHYHFREYSPSLGGWLTRDPIGLAGGYLNLRSYLGNRPADALDVWGEAAVVYFKYKEDYERAVRYKNNCGGGGFYRNTQLVFAPEEDANSGIYDEDGPNEVTEDGIKYDQGVFRGTDAAWYFNDTQHAKIITDWHKKEFSKFSLMALLISINIGNGALPKASPHEYPISIRKVSRPEAPRIKIQTKNRETCLCPSTKKETSDSSGRLQPHTEATGAHTSFKVDPQTGKVTKYETFQPQPNPRNPTPWESVKRVDTQYAAPGTHYNKATRTEVPTPHVHERSTPGGVRPATPDELPQ